VSQAALGNCHTLRMAANHFDDLRALAEKFTRGGWPDMLCPSCSRGALTPAGEDAIRLVESAESRAAQDHSDWEPEWTNGHFQGELRCNRAGCRDSVLAVGRYSTVQDDNGEWSYEPAFRPMYFLPALLLIISDGRFPNSVVDMANEASAVLWTDPSSAANRVRSAVEQLLTLQKVPRSIITKNHKRQSLKLHDRITRFEKRQTKHAAAAELLKAVKWIGNDGSHGSGLTACQVIDAAELLERALSLIYDKHERELAQKAARINKRRGVR
jgi:Domain of unknown function (DUF4145)